MLSISLVIAIVLFFLAPSLIILLLGKEYSPSIKLFQILVLATPLFAIGNALGMQWMIPNKFDRAYNIIIGFAAVFGLITIVYLAPMFKALGIIAGFICSELFVCCAIIFFLNKKVQNPFKKRNGNI